MTDEDGEIKELAPWLAIVITLIGGGIRIFMLDKQGMSLDETFNLWLSGHSITDMLQWIVRIGVHPPLYYLLLHYWTELNGTAPYYARMLSALLGAATIPFIYLTGKRLAGDVVGLAAALLLAISPFSIRFAQDTTPYTLLAFNAAVALYALVRLLTDPRSTRPIGSQLREYLHAWRTPGLAEPDKEEEFTYKAKSRAPAWWTAWVARHQWLPIQAVETDLAWMVFILFSALTLYSHNTAILFLLSANAFVVGLLLYQGVRKTSTIPSLQAPSVGSWLIAQVVIVLLWSPWIPSFIQQASRVYQEFWISRPGWSTIVLAVQSFLDEPTPGQATQPLVIWVLFAVLLCLGVLQYRKKLAQLAFLASLFILPLLGELVVSLRRPVFLDKTLIWTTIPLFLLLAAGIALVKRRLLIILLVGIFGTVNLASASDYFRWGQKEDWSNPAGFVANFVQKDDLILFNATRAQIPFDYYFVPYEKLYLLQVEKHGLPVDLFDSGILEPQMAQGDLPRLEALLSGHSRVWLVYADSQHTDPLGLIPQALASKMKLIVQRDYGGSLVEFYMAP